MEERKPIASDGGSSSYYDMYVPEWLLTKLLERSAEGKCYIKTEEIIEAMFDSDFDAGTAFKSLVRVWGNLQGAGKAGNTVGYECNKIKYYANRLNERGDRVES